MCHFQEFAGYFGDDKMSYQLTTPAEAVGSLASFFGNMAGSPVKLTVQEDKCFPCDGHLNLGSIHLRPGPKTSSTEDDSLSVAVKNGFFEWALPEYSTVVASVNTLLANGPSNPKQKEKAEFALRSVAALCVRTGLLHPVFDADAVSNMPFIRPTTVITDTSAVLHGGLDFLVRFLYPIARVKVPAIVHMEILNNCDNFLKLRRQQEGSLKKSELLLAHVNSQGGQRVLLRLELQTDTEIERTSLFPDPLRNAFTPDKESDGKDLNIAAPVRSYCDRLILESARQHQAHASPGHPVMVMTTDQGLARMSLAEGIQALFYEVPKTQEVFGRTLGGTCFHPFSGGLYGVGLCELLWELAVTFGSARLSSDDGRQFVEVAAIGETLSWHPFHSKDDLLWVRTQTAPSHVPLAHAATQEAESSRNNDGPPPSTTNPKSSQKASVPYSGCYRFRVEDMLHLIVELGRKGKVSEEEAHRLVHVKSSSLFRDYKNFLLAANLVEVSDAALLKKDAVDVACTSLRTGNLEGLARVFLAVPSFAIYIDKLASQSVAKNASSLVVDRCASTYLALAEICGLAYRIPNEGIFATANNPPASQFAPLAIGAYLSLAHTEDYVLTGSWLEALVRTHGIHPLRARQRLEEARVAGHLQRFTEGATPETRFETHLFHEVVWQQDAPIVATVHTYHGDFLIPGKASVSLRLELVKK